MAEVNFLVKKGLTVPKGSASTPSVIFDASDPNTGLYSPGADQVAVATNGTGRLFVSSAGLVGVGTSTPDSYYSGANNLVVANTSGNAGITIATSTTGTGRVYFADGTSGADEYRGWIEYEHTANSLTFGSNGSERLRITSAGLVGIGTSSPGEALEVVGKARVLNNTGATNTGDQNVVVVGSSTSGAFSSTYGAGLQFQIANSSGGYSGSRIVSRLNADNNTANLVFQSRNYGFSDAMTLDSSGRVGIGTSTPSRNLTVSNTAANAFIGIQGSNTSTPGLLFGDTESDAIGQIRYDHPTDKMSFHVNGADRVFIDSSGRVGIGTTSPAQVLDVQGGANRTPIAFKGNASGTGYLYADNSSFGIKTSAGSLTGTDAFVGVDTANTILFLTSGTDRARIDPSGRLLVGTSSSTYNISNQSKQAIVVTGNLNRGGLDITGYTGGGSTGASPEVNFNRSIGTTDGSVSAINAFGWRLGVIRFNGANGSGFGVGAEIAAISNSSTYTTTSSPAYLSFSTTPNGANFPTERMRITSGGNILIGRTDDGDNANVEGIRLAAGGTSYMYASGKTCLSIARQTDNGTAVEFRRGSGTPIVGTISVTTTATAYNTSSDYRLKENVTPVSDGITRLQQLKPSRFNFIADPDTVVDGFLAHEAQAVVPECVTGEKDAVDDDGNPVYQGIDQSKLVPLLTAALQEAIGRIETLEGMVAVNNITIDEQQHQLSTLAARLTALESP
jgi:hypothetical protein